MMFLRQYVVIDNNLYIINRHRKATFYENS